MNLCILIYFTFSNLDGLEPIDFDGFQILTNSTLVTDPSTEDHFRLDRM
jgi:CREB-regulated transcription coactivator 1